MAVASAGTCASLHLAPDRQHTSTPPLSFLKAGCPSCRPTNSIKAVKANEKSMKAVNEITARQTRTSLRKHDVTKVCNIKYLTAQIELVLPTFFQLLDRSQNYRTFNVKAIV